MWFDFQEGDFNEILRLARMYRRQADCCERAKAYVAGCAVAGAALEALLLAVIHMYGAEIDAAGRTPRDKKGRVKSIRKLRLSEMLDIADRMGWLPDISLTSTKRAKPNIGHYAQSVRQLRNLVHPVCYVQDHSLSRITKRYLKYAIQVLDLANDYLVALVNKSLKKAIREGRI
jgi:hypothetical protein